MSRVLLSLCVLTQKIIRMLEKIRELRGKILDKDDLIHDLLTRAQWAERRVAGLVAQVAEKDAEIAEKNIKIAENEAEIAALKAELAAVGAGEQANLGEGGAKRDHKRKRTHQ
ncbi:uncharacterized protein EAF01_010698 [Botrytis porri]|uniref:Uncharacterized protein n=1 Tax=Botrytis porri TaxID=87229 RepID=A0A4Z1K4A1_9HELO|nr:uncharacterized protein EAF01_010698 [Botrytis porri]KAF7890889.1 hypothetical protein EAF01_010698 [Botrytis porri]TGO80929.1 hypothetical protein BPOR_1513g00010 [Botrytis porri]